MKLVNIFSQPASHCEDATAHLLSALNIKFTKTYLQKELTEHPDYPSLASIADVIGMSYDVSCASLRISIKEYQNLSDFRLPFLAQIRPKDFQYDVFVVITNLTNDDVYLYNTTTRKNEKHTLSDFEELYKGVVLIVESGGKTQEDNFENNLQKEKETNLSNAFAILTLPIITVFVLCFYLVSTTVSLAIAPVIFTIFVLAGSIVTTLLLWHEVDQYNPIVRQICQTTTHINCSAVLNSKASKIKGLSWSSMGFVYFTGMLLTLLVTGISKSSLVFLACLSVLALPYTIFSLYYQWRIVKQWCILCLAVQGILLMLFATAIWGKFYSWEIAKSIPAYSFFGYCASFVFVFIVTIVLMPALQKAKSNKQKTIELQRMKHNPQIFEGVLAKQKLMPKPTDGLGITIGNPNSAFKLIKVCNPYCGPCAKAHPIIEELVANNDELSAQIIFTATEDEKDIKREPVMHLLAIAEKGNALLTKQALDDWYLADKKDYAAFAAKYPMSGELDRQIGKIKIMREWCDAVQINFTPTFFVAVNNYEDNPKFYQLPDMYTITDLKYFLTI